MPFHCGSLAREPQNRHIHIDLSDTEMLIKRMSKRKGCSQDSVDNAVHLTGALSVWKNKSAVISEGMRNA